MNEYKEFKKYAKGHVGISGLDLHNYEKQVESGLYTGQSNSISPMILEEREMRATMMSVFDRLMMDRLLWVAGTVSDNMSAVTQAQLMFLDNTGSEDITMHIDSPGGSVKAGLSMVDVMEYIKSDIKTVNMGMAASMGSVLLGAGTKGKRSSLRHSKTMLHQSSGGFSGNIQDAEIDMKEWKKVNDILFKLLGEYCDKTAKQVAEDATRDFWLTADEAKKYGIIDSVIKRRK